jgi:hypothetical protein
MKNVLRAFLVFLLASFHHQAYSQSLECLQMFLKEDLILRSMDQQPAGFDAGEGVTFRLVAGVNENKLAGPAHSWMSITVLDRGKSVKAFADSFYTAYGFFSSGHARFWMIEEYTGGMHCCTRYHFFARPEADQPLRYLGSTLGSSPALEEEPFLCRDGVIYLKDFDIRFLYFHTPYVQSRLEVPIYYRLTPSSLFIDNRPFRKEYLEEAASLDREMKAMVARRKGKPFSILRKNKDSPFFSDEVGQLLVKQALLYLYAGDDRNAWATLDQGVRQYYRSTEGLSKITLEIKKILRETPY